MPVIIEFSRCIGTYSSAKFEDIIRKAVYSQEELSLEEWNFVYDFLMISTKRDQEIQQNIQKEK